MPTEENMPEPNIDYAPIPIALFCFNRPYLLVQVLEAIAEQTEFPPVILAYLDGARSQKDEQAVNECLELLESFTACPIKIIHREKNYGCEKNIIGGINETLQQYQAVIILEDDTVPSPHFYKAMKEALIRHSDKSDIAAICGLNVMRKALERIPGNQAFIINLENSEEELILSQLFTCTGWAIWQKSWLEISRTMFSPYTFKQLLSIPFKPPFYHYYIFIYKNITGEINNEWSYKLSLALFQQKKYVLTFKKTLLKNIGFFNADSVHGNGSLENEIAHNKYFDPNYSPNNLELKRYQFIESYHFYYLPLHLLNKIKNRICT